LVSIEILSLVQNHFYNLNFVPGEKEWWKIKHRLIAINPLLVNIEKVFFTALAFNCVGKMWLAG